MSCTIARTKGNALLAEATVNNVRGASLALMNKPPFAHSPSLAFVQPRSPDRHPNLPHGTITRPNLGQNSQQELFVLRRKLEGARFTFYPNRFVKHLRFCHRRRIECCLAPTHFQRQLRVVDDASIATEATEVVI